MASKFWKSHQGLKRGVLAPVNLLYRMNNRLGISVVYLLTLRSWPNLKNPRSFNEKLQWIKLNHRDPLYPVCADKYAVRRYVAECDCPELLVKLLWVGEDPADIPFDDLPDKFVLKTSHGCGYNIICTDKSTLDRADAVRQLEHWRHEKYLECYGEWFYGVEPVRILAEAFVEGDAPGAVPDDYKVLCFGGEPRLVQMDCGRFTGHHYRNVYSTDWELLDYRVSMDNDLSRPAPRPALLEDMLACARRLAGPFPFARIDFYISGGRLLLGEITLTHGAGFSQLEPAGLSDTLGDWIPLPTKK